MLYAYTILTLTIIGMAIIISVMICDQKGGNDEAKM